MSAGKVLEDKGHLSLIMIHFSASSSVESLNWINSNFFLFRLRLVWSIGRENWEERRYSEGIQVKIHHFKTSSISPKSLLCRYERYPSFCGGLAYFITKSALTKILRKYSQGNDYLWLDDVFITGILSHKAGVHLIDVKVWRYHEVNTNMTC